MIPVRSRRSHSALRHIGAAIWSTHDPAQCWMVTYRAYYDASGAETDATGTMVVYGLIASEKQWIRFEAQWEKLLRAEGLKSLHMTSVFADLKARHPNEADDAIGARADALYTRALRVITPHARKPFSVSLRIEDYRILNREFTLRESFGKGYAFTAALCMQQVQEWRRVRHPHAPIAHIFEAGDNGQEALTEVIPKMAAQGFTCAVVPKRDPATGLRTRAFEAADYLAWETRRIHQASAAGRRLRPMAHVVHRALPFNDRALTLPGLQKLCEVLGVPRRTPT